MPDATHLHLAISHAPVIGVLIGIVLLAWGLLRRNDEVKRASLALFVACALAGAVTFATGESAEERVEHFAGVSEAAIEAHEAAAKIAVAATYVLGAASLVGLLVIWKWRARGNLALAGVLVLSLLAGGLLARAANLGGQIRHTEIASPAQLSHAGHDDD